MLVEGSEAIFSEGGRRAQLAGTQRRQRLARRLDIFRGRRKTLGQRQQAIEAHALHLKPPTRRPPPRILTPPRHPPRIAPPQPTRHVSPPLTSPRRSSPPP